MPDPEALPFKQEGLHVITNQQVCRDFIKLNGLVGLEQRITTAGLFYTRAKGEPAGGDSGVWVDVEIEKTLKGQIIYKLYVISADYGDEFVNKLFDHIEQLRADYRTTRAWFNVRKPKIVVTTKQQLERKDSN